MVKLVTGEAAISTRVETITPDGALEVLCAQGAANRRLSDGHVAQLARVLKEGKWVLNGESIKFDTNGHLIDGQHRLAAVVQANISMTTLVTYNCPAEAFVTLDSGRRRVLRDALRIRGEKQATQLAAVVTAYWRYSHGHFMNGDSRWARRDTYPTTEESLALLDGSPLLKDAARIASTIGNVLGAGTAIGLAYYLLVLRLPEEEPKWTAMEFFAQLRQGANLDAHNPVYRLRERLRANKAARTKLDQVEALALILKSWNAWRTGKDMRSLMWRASNEQFPEPVA